MNFDPYDSAAWRTFGMLDPDERAVFDDARRDDPALQKVSLEMDRLAAAIAVSAASPIVPAAGLLEGIQARVKLKPARHASHWLAISGWVAALTLALVLILSRHGTTDSPAVSPPPPDTLSPTATASIGSPSDPAAERLNREIRELRKNLEQYQHRDRTLFTAIPGRALPVVMIMNPPGLVTEDFQITTLLGDALRAATFVSDETLEDSLPQETSFPQEEPLAQPDPTDLVEEPPAPPSAMPIYDSARDFGTLIISNLPHTTEDEAYNLWAIAQPSSEPIYVGSLPQSISTDADSFDFSFGSTMVMPSAFILTRDPVNRPASPTKSNIVLQSPTRLSP